MKTDWEIIEQFIEDERYHHHNQAPNLLLALSRMLLEKLRGVLESPTMTSHNNKTYPTSIQCGKCGHAVEVETHVTTTLRTKP